MDPRYATFIWGSYGLTALVIAWNLLAPWLARNQLRQRLSERAEDDLERSGDE
ncbi:MAG: heme exporter protein CcmD [Stagnimonas sp.]|nr:heme exporter protein CcmD [Stagnimonas sp.]